MTENQNQLWRKQVCGKVFDIVTENRYIHAQTHDFNTSEKLADDIIKEHNDVVQRQRPATCNCPALREALEAAIKLLRIHVNLSRQDAEQFDEALAATPCTSGGKSEAEHEHALFVACDAARESLRRAEADRDQWKERAALAESEQDKLMERSVFAMSIMEDDNKLWQDAYSRSDKCPMLTTAFKLRTDRDRLFKIAEKALTDVLETPQHSTAWIPLHGPGSRRPTEADADERGNITKRDEFRTWTGRFDVIGNTGLYTHWHALTKFTPAPDPDTEREWQLNYNGGLIAGDKLFYPGRQMAIEIAAEHNSALAHRDAQQKEK